MNLDFNVGQYSPEFGSDHKQLAPCKKVKVFLAGEKIVPTRSGQGQMVVFTLRVAEGPMQNQEQTVRLNLWHVNPQTVEIARKQLAAFFAVTGIQNPQATEQMQNRPFLIDVDWQDGQAPTQEKPDGGFTEVKALYDLAGNSPGKNGGGQQQAPAPLAPPPAQVVPLNPPPQNPNSFAPAPAAWQPNPNGNGGAQGNNWNNK